MARTKKKGQSLGGQLQSARAKHDTALGAEILGKIAAKPAKDKKPTKVKMPKTKVYLDEAARSGKKPSRKSVQDAEKDQRREHKKELTEMLASDLEIESPKASELIKRSNTQFTMSQMSRAASALHELKGGSFTEAEFMAKAAEYHEGDNQVEEQAIQSKAARKAEASQSGNKKAKKRAENKAELAPQPATSHVPERQRNGQTGGVLPVKPGNDGFSIEFWQDLAGSREAAAAAATAS